MDSKMTFNVFKNMIIEQNKVLLKEVSKVTGINESKLIDNYIKPEYYLPVIIKTQQGQETKKEK